MITIELVSETKGIPQKKDVRKDKTASDYYRLGQESAFLEAKRNAIETKQAVADMYSNMIMAQSRNILNTVLADVARTLAQIKFNNTFITEYIKMISNGTFQPPPPLTPLQLPTLGNSDMGGTEQFSAPQPPPFPTPESGGLAPPPDSGPAFSAMGGGSQM